MARIKHNGKIIEFEKIVAYGCSYTAGCETSDHFFFPDKTVEQVDALKLSLGIEKFMELPEVQQAGGSYYLFEKCKEYSWVKIIANYFDVPLTNRSEPGGSMQIITYLLEQDIASGTIDESTLVLVGLTGMDRWMWLDQEGNFKRAHFMQSRYWPTETFHKEFILNVANDAFNCYHWYKEVKHIDMLSKSLDGRILQQPCLSGTYLFPYINYDHFIPELKNIMATTKTFTSMIDVNFCFRNVIEKLENGKDNVHGFWHPKIHQQQKFARYILDLIKYD